MPTLKRASRSAGRKLAIMLALLLIPVAALLYVYTSSALVDVRLGQRQLLGVDYLRTIAKIYGSALNGQSISEVDLKALAAVPQQLVTQRRMLQDEVQNAVALFQSDAKTGPAHMWQLRTVVLDVAAASDLALGRYREHQLLANAYAAHLPELANLLHAISEKTQRETLSAEFSVLRGAAFLAVTDAIKEDKTGDIGKAMNLALSEFDAAADRFDEHLALNMHLQSTDVAMNMIEKVDALSRVALQVLGEKIGGRTETLRRELAAVLAVIAAASAFAIGFAVHMVRATFRKLDTVEAAKIAIENSEANTRAFAEDMQRLNGEIATLNVDLTRNYKLLEDTQADNLRKSKMAQVGALTAMVAHELRNPLGAVRTSSFTIDKMSKKWGVDFEKQTDRINHAVTRCDTTITQLLNYASSNDIHRQVLMLNDWLERLLKDEVADMPASIEVEYEDSVGSVELAFDSEKLGHSLRNVLKNASQALMISAGDDIAKISVSSALVENGVSICVADNGPGIPADKLPMVKEPLFTTKSFGPGLGLAIAEQVTSLHGGTLDVQSDLGRGTKVTMWLPFDMETQKRISHM